MAMRVRATGLLGSNVHVQGRTMEWETNKGRPDYSSTSTDFCQPAWDRRSGRTYMLALGKYDSRQKIQHKTPRAPTPRRAAQGKQRATKNAVDLRGKTEATKQVENAACMVCTHTHTHTHTRERCKPQQNTRQNTNEVKLLQQEPFPTTPSIINQKRSMVEKKKSRSSIFDILCFLSKTNGRAAPT